MRSKIIFIFRCVVLAGFVLILVNPVRGHVQLDSPNGGEILEVGSIFTITWQVVVGHDQQNWDLWYSTDGGTNWAPIEMEIPTGNPDAGSTHTYDWTVPGTPSDQARVLVRQDNSDTDYHDDSNSNFAITAGTCPSTVVYGAHSEETERLRHIRDNILSQTSEGQEIIRLYYQWSPVIVKAMKADEGFQIEVKEMCDRVLELLRGGEK